MHVQLDVHIYNNNSKVQKDADMLSTAVPSRCRVPPIRAPISGENLHIVKGRDKLRELSRVPTVYQYGMQSECPIHTILKYFSFFLFKIVHYYASGFILFLPVPLFYKTLFFSRVLFYTRTHTENVIMYQ